MDSPRGGGRGKDSRWQLTHPGDVRSITATKAVGSSNVNLDDDDKDDYGYDYDYFLDRAEHKFRGTLDLPNRSLAPLVP